MIEVENGATLKLSTDEKFKDGGDQTTIFVDYEKIVDVCSIGDLIDIDDSVVKVKVTGKHSTCLETGEYYIPTYCF